MPRSSLRARQTSPDRPRRTAGRALPSPPLTLLAILAVALAVAGGSSMADVLGQPVVRSVAAACLGVLALIGPRARIEPYAATAFLLVAAVIIVLLELVPLPPSIWLHLPGRAGFAEAAALAGAPQPWRPIAIVPGAALNAAGSLLVPIATFALFVSLAVRDRQLVLTGTLIFITIAALVGLLQATGTPYDNPLINDGPGEISGVFANRNHFALLLAIGCVLAPVWVFADVDPVALGWRGPLAGGLVALFVLLIIVSGSRAGLILGLMGSVAGLALVSGRLRGALRGYPRWVFIALIVVLLVTVVSVVLVSLGAGRSLGIDRALGSELADGVRSGSAPVVRAMVWEYFPVGIGAGGFDPLFRAHEPLALLSAYYLNHAHNDFVELVLEHGVAGVVMLLVAVASWGRLSVRGWRHPGDPEALLVRATSVVLLMIGAASTVDYPGRTPIFMALLVIFGCWMATPLSAGRRAVARNQSPRRAAEPIAEPPLGPLPDQSERL